MFVIPEVLLGFPSVPVDWGLTFSFHHILYFWFAFVLCNPIWVVVPVAMIASAHKHLCDVLGPAKPGAGATGKAQVKAAKQH